MNNVALTNISNSTILDSSFDLGHLSGKCFSKVIFAYLFTGILVSNYFNGMMLMRLSIAQSSI